jgi:hypothetical protein
MAMMLDAISDNETERHVTFTTKDESVAVCLIVRALGKEMEKPGKKSKAELLQYS